jgi:hypothetical protein
MVDDEGNEIIPKKQEETKPTSISGEAPRATSDEPLVRDENGRALNMSSRRELLSMLDEMKKHIDDLPQHAQFAPVTHADWSALLGLLSLLFRSS